MAQYRETDSGGLAVRIKGASYTATTSGKWADVPMEKLHPFSQNVRLTMMEAEKLTRALDANEQSEIQRGLIASRSAFLQNLKIVLKTQTIPDESLLSIFDELAEQLQALKAALVKRFGPKTKFLAAEIDRLIKDVCVECRLDDVYRMKDIFTLLCRFCRDLLPADLPMPSYEETQREMCDSLSINRRLSAVEQNISKEGERRTKAVSLDNESIGKIVNGVVEAIPKVKVQKRGHKLPATAKVARDSKRESEKKDTDAVVREISTRWRAHGNSKSRMEIIKDLKNDPAWKLRIHVSDGTLERYAKGFR